jgi:hypothetical protein
MPTVCPVCFIEIAEAGPKCPACGSPIRRKQTALWIAVAATAVIGAVLIGWMTRKKPASVDPIAAKIVLSPCLYKLTPNGAQTFVDGQFVNQNAFPVDITIRVVGLEAGDRIYATKDLGPFLSVKPGETKRVWHTFDSTPFQGVYLEVKHVEKSSEN